MSWRDVPMPESVANLPRSSGGLPVPHIVSWTGERDSYYVGDDDDDDLAAIGCPHPAIESSGGYGEGRAIFGQADPARQRAAFLQRRCQVCNGGLEGGALLLVESRTGPHTEPWLCRDCAAYALRVCPALSAREGLRVLEVTRGEVEVLTHNHEDGTPVAVYVTLWPTEARETTVAEFLAIARRGREERARGEGTIDPTDSRMESGNPPTVSQDVSPRGAQQAHETGNPRSALCPRLDRSRD